MPLPVPPDRGAETLLARGLRIGRSPVVALMLGALGLALLYQEPLRTGFLNDDYLFLEQARSQPVLASLTRPGAIGNYYRPLSRQIYFAALSPIGGGRPPVFHAVNFALFLAALALLFDLLMALVPAAGAMAGTLFFALLPLQRVNLIWISCSQDLLALTLALLALALYRRGSRRRALLTALGALASKEIALALPVALFAWSTLVEGLGTRAAFQRAAPFFALSVVWGLVSLRVALAAGPLTGGLHFDPEHFLAGLAHEAQSLLGLEHPAGMPRALLAFGPPPLPFLVLAALALWVPGPGAPEEKRRRRGVAPFACAWLLGFGLLTGPVSGIWSGYFYTVPAVGGAILFGLLLRRAGRTLWVILVALLLWWHAAGSGTRAIGVSPDPWGWTSHLTNAYFRRAAWLTGTLSRQLQALEPSPPGGARLFFATLPPWAGFQMGNGALVRALYRDRSLESYFFSQFSESTAADRPCRFFYWDGAGLRTLYRNLADPYFQVGADLLLLDRPAGAAHAFRRALGAGGNRADNLYWLGWAELWSGRRDAAEAAWKSLGAVDDTLRWSRNLAAARMALVAFGDTLEGRRTLAEAIRYGIGRPEPHGLLGGLLLARQPKYAMLELKVATYLNAEDWLSRRALLGALLDARLTDSARRELEALMSRHPELGADPIVMRARRELGRAEPGSGVVEF